MLCTMLIANIFLLLICLQNTVQLAFGLRFANNACKNYNDYPVWFMSNNCYYNPDVLSDTPAMIRRNGYPVEGHIVTSEDGYILNMFRIPTLSNKRNKQPVFLLNGLVTTNAVWVNNGNQSLAFFLADEGFDVWLGAVRGTSYAKAHKKLRNTNKEYWEFTLDTIARLDVSQQLRHVAETTKKAGKIIYIGHSMGTTLGFMYMSWNPSEVQRLLSGMVALAPVAYLTDINVVKNLFEVIPSIKNQIEKRNITAINNQESFNRIATYVCTFIPNLCKSIIHMCYGDFSGQFLPEYLLLHFSYFPVAVSVKILLQYEQIARTGSFRHFDFGREKNKIKYVLDQPPKYELSRIRLPVYMFYGKSDVLSTEKNVERLFNEIGSEKKTMQHIPRNTHLPPFNHLDFILAKDAKLLLYVELLKVLEELA